MNDIQKECLRRKYAKVTVFDRLYVIFHSSFWTMNYDYSSLWDQQLRELVKTTKFQNLTGHNVHLGKWTLWIANHPYASFHSPAQSRPSRATLRMLRRVLDYDIITAELEKIK